MTLPIEPMTAPFWAHILGLFPLLPPIVVVYRRKCSPGFGLCKGRGKELGEDRLLALALLSSMGLSTAIKKCTSSNLVGSTFQYWNSPGNVTPSKDHSPKNYQLLDLDCKLRREYFELKFRCKRSRRS